MKSLLSNRSKTLWISAFLLVLIGLFLFVALRAGPLAPVPVTSIMVMSMHTLPMTGAGTPFTRKLPRPLLSLRLMPSP